MALYTFYCSGADGASIHLDVRELNDDLAAAEHGARLLRDHASCTRVDILNGERELSPVLREEMSEAPEVDPLVLEQLRQVDRLAKGLAVIATNPDGVVVYWNAGARALYGWEEQQAVGRSILEVTPALQSRAEASRIMQALRAGQSWQGEIVLRRRDGTPFYAFVTNVPIGAVAEGRGVIVGLSVAAAERRRLDARRSELERLVRDASIVSGAVA